MAFKSFVDDRASVSEKAFFEAAGLLSNIAVATFVNVYLKHATYPFASTQYGLRGSLVLLGRTLAIWTASVAAGNHTQRAIEGISTEYVDAREMLAAYNKKAK